MTYIHNKRRRDAAVLPIVTVCMIGLMGFVALSIDIGMMTVARTQCQNAADIAALAGARTLDGKSTANNVATATAEARAAAQNNSILNTAITAAQVVTVQAGIYRHDTTAQRFQAVFGEAPAANEAYGLMQVAIMSQQPTVFAKVLGVQSVNVGAVATAVHRPRDISIVLDLSGSMGYSSQPAYPDAGTITGSLNPDSRFPRFGPWSIWGGAGMVLDPENPGTSPANLNTYVPPTPMQRVFTYVDPGGETRAPNNHTLDTRNGPAIVGNFLQSDNSTAAFIRADPDAAFPTFTNVNVSTSGNPTTIVTPAPADFSNQNSATFFGDKFPLRSGVTTTGAPTPDQYAQTVADYLGIVRTSVTDTTRNATFEQNGYDWDFATAALKPAAQRFQGLTMGPGYYGKTFYMWPPDPRAPVGHIGDAGYVAGDWRQRFFLPRTSSGQDQRDNSMFWATATGRWKPQAAGASANYIVNYDNIIKWLKRGPVTLPPSLRSGRVVYYDAIPDTIPINASTGVLQGTATLEQRFWKDYIDYVLAAGRHTDTQVIFGANSSNSNTRAGANLHYNNPATSALAVKITPRATLVASAGSNPVPYMRYDDNPVHPRGQFWFGPMTMLSFIQKRTYFSGTCYEAPCWQLKVGIKAAVDDIKNNHPNDMASLIFFSGSAGYNVTRVGMGKDYTKIQNALFYPFPLLDTLGNVTSSVRPYAAGTIDAGAPSGLYDNTDTIIPNGGTSTCPQMGLMLAFNEFGFASAGSKTYTGRKGTSKVVIFETDGVPNITCNGTLTKTGNGEAGRWYYGGVGTPTWFGNSSALHVAPKDNARAVVRQIVAMDNEGVPGFSTARNPARVHALAFGELFEDATPSPMKAAAFQFLAAVQIDGKTSPTPPGSWDTDSLDYMTYYVNREPFKIITGDYQTRIDKIRQAMERIMQGGVQVALIQ
ncbi:MAG: hypothetical protein K8T89_23610 [Planctomycetes bacterium]|nr:hypothetical protein [Planctomycetota bacterium]